MSIKARLRQTPMLGLLLEFVHKKILTRTPSKSLEIRLLARKLKPNAVVVQIGSNDGVSNDPLHDAIKTHRGWRCVFVEPVPWLIDKCRCAYGSDKRFMYVNAAINDGTPAPFFFVDALARVERPDLPDFVLQLGSFNERHILGYNNGVLAPYVRSLNVVGLSWAQLVEQTGAWPVDILHIDAEGYDWKILSQVDLSIDPPKIILFEVEHLKPAELQQAVTALSERYSVVRMGGDIMAVRDDIGGVRGL